MAGARGTFRKSWGPRGFHHLTRGPPFLSDEQIENLVRRVCVCGVCVVCGCACVWLLRLYPNAVCGLICTR